MSGRHISAAATAKAKVCGDGKAGFAGARVRRARMDRAERIAAVRARLNRMQRKEVEAREAGPPCRSCIHFAADRSAGLWAEALPLCTHLANTLRRFDPVAGRFSESFPVDAPQARTEEGLCGPEGLLFERLPFPRLVLQKLFGSANGAGPAALLILSGMAGLLAL